MGVNCLVSDLIVRIRNGYSAGKESILVLKSNFIGAILTTLKKEGYIKDYEIHDFKYFSVQLRYVKDNIPVLSKIRRISKPGCRRYIKLGDTSIKKINTFEKIIVTTSDGVMTLNESKKGGEVLLGVV